MTDAKLYCMVEVESKVSFTGREKQSFDAVAYAVSEDELTFSLPDGGRKVFNWHKVLWFETEPIETDEADE